MDGIGFMAYWRVGVGAVHWARLSFGVQDNDLMTISYYYFIAYPDSGEVAISQFWSISCLVLSTGRLQCIQRNGTLCRVCHTHIHLNYIYANNRGTHTMSYTSEWKYTVYLCQWLWKTKAYPYRILWHCVYGWSWYLQSRLTMTFCFVFMIN